MTKKRKPDLILSADWHLREDTPACWSEPFLPHLLKTVEFIMDLRRDMGCPLLIAGDVFHHWKPSPYLLGKVLGAFAEGESDPMGGAIAAIPGQHDLPQHSLEGFSKSGLHVLEMAGMVTASIVQGEGFYGLHADYVPYAFPWGTGNTIPEADMAGVRKMSIPIALMHRMVYRKREPWPGCPAPKASALLREMAGFPLVVAGDNHDGFTYRKGDQLLVVPGSIMQMTAAQIDYKPRVYLWFADDNSVELVYLPDHSDKMTRDHIDQQEERDERMEAFVRSMSGNVDLKEGFVENLRRAVAKANLDEETASLIWEAVEEQR
jgi:DNA repair exonuclease SbcCD nuclease subunit